MDMKRIDKKPTKGERLHPKAQKTMGDGRNKYCSPRN